MRSLLLLLLAAKAVLSLPPVSASEWLEVAVCRASGEKKPWVRVVRHAETCDIRLHTSAGMEDIFAERKQQEKTERGFANEAVRSDLRSDLIWGKCVGAKRALLVVTGQYTYFGNTNYTVSLLYDAETGKIERIDSAAREQPILFYYNSEELRILYPDAYAGHGQAPRFHLYRRRIGADSLFMEEHEHTDTLPSVEGFTVLEIPKDFSGW